MPLVTLKYILDTALREGFAVGAYNVHTPHEAEAAIRIHELFRAPCVLQFIQFSAPFMSGSGELFSKDLEAANKGIQNFCRHVLPIIEKAKIPVALHLDHGNSFEITKMCVDNGFSGVMIDGSAYDLETNIELTSRVVEYAHDRGVSVEAELGVLAGREDSEHRVSETYTNPSVVCDFVKRTGVDCLALSYGTVHGAAKGKSVKIRKEIATASMELMRWDDCVVPLVSHGSSLVKKNVVAAINRMGGDIQQANGVPLEQLLEVIPCGIAKINVGTDIRLAIDRGLREYFLGTGELNATEKKIYQIIESSPNAIDERVFLEPIREQLTSYTDNDDCRNIINIVQDAVMQTIGELIVAFGYADTADLFTQE